jgi:hypothetical protein
VKVIVFSEWERMLDLVRGLCRRLRLGHAWHTGSVPQQKRRAEIRAFKDDPGCRVFLSTGSGAAGLNLQNASVAINCDLPWNPAKLEQRIARAWRKHQTRAVTVINLVAENTIEHRMLDTLAQKQALADCGSVGKEPRAPCRPSAGLRGIVERADRLRAGGRVAHAVAGHGWRFACPAPVHGTRRACGGAACFSRKTRVRNGWRNCGAVGASCGVVNTRREDLLWWSAGCDVACDGIASGGQTA